MQASPVYPHRFVLHAARAHERLRPRWSTTSQNRLIPPRQRRAEFARHSSARTRHVRRWDKVAGAGHKPGGRSLDSPIRARF